MSAFGTDPTADGGQLDAGSAEVADAAPEPGDATTSVDQVEGADAPVSDGGDPDTGDTDAFSPDSAAIDATNPDSSNTDHTPPTVVSTNPRANATDVSTTKGLTATFSEAVDPTTVNALTFTLQQGTTPIPGTVTYAATGMTGTFLPTNPLAAKVTYTARITTGVTDAAGNPMPDNYTWSFTTSACGQAGVALGAAAPFAVLAGSTVTNTGPTSVIGDLGVSPGTAVTGFGPGVIVGAQHAGDPTAAEGQASLTTAYVDSVGRTLCAVMVVGDLGGRTLAPGLYKSTGSIEISSGNLTLDANGDTEAVFIFQMTSTLITAASNQIALVGGAKAANVFWQVGTSATLGAMSTFQGTVMAFQSVTLSAGATVNGRVLARNAAVTLSSNTVVKPTP